MTIINSIQTCIEKLTGIEFEQKYAESAIHWYWVWIESSMHWYWNSTLSLSLNRNILNVPSFGIELNSLIGSTNQLLEASHAVIKVAWCGVGCISYNGCILYDGLYVAWCTSWFWYPSISLLLYAVCVDRANIYKNQ